MEQWYEVCTIIAVSFIRNNKETTTKHGENIHQYTHNTHDNRDFLLCQVHNRLIQSERVSNFLQSKALNMRVRERVQEYNVKENVKGKLKLLTLLNNVNCE